MYRYRGDAAPNTAAAAAAVPMPDPFHEGLGWNGDNESPSTEENYGVGYEDRYDESIANRQQRGGAAQRQRRRTPEVGSGGAASQDHANISLHRDPYTAPRGAPRVPAAAALDGGGLSSASGTAAAVLHPLRRPEAIARQCAEAASAIQASVTTDDRTWRNVQPAVVRATQALFQHMEGIAETQLDLHRFVAHEVGAGTAEMNILRQELIETHTQLRDLAREFANAESARSKLLANLAKNDRAGHTRRGDSNEPRAAVAEDDVRLLRAQLAALQHEVTHLRQDREKEKEGDGYGGGFERPVPKKMTASHKLRGHDGTTRSQTSSGDDSDYNGLSLDRHEGCASTSSTSDGMVEELPARRQQHNDDRLRRAPSSKKQKNPSISEDLHRAVGRCTAATARVERDMDDAGEALQRLRRRVDANEAAVEHVAKAVGDMTSKSRPLRDGAGEGVVGADAVAALHDRISHVAAEVRGIEDRFLQTLEDLSRPGATCAPGSLGHALRQLVHTNLMTTSTSGSAASGSSPDACHCRWALTKSEVSAFVEAERRRRGASASARLGTIPWPRRVYKHGHSLRWNSDCPQAVFADRSGIFEIDVCVVLATGDDGRTLVAGCRSGPTAVAARSTMASTRLLPMLQLTIDDEPLHATTTLGTSKATTLHSVRCGFAHHHLTLCERVYACAGSVIAVRLVDSGRFVADIVEAVLDIRLLSAGCC